jgi:hypothetical protein
MIVIDPGTREIVVERDPARDRVELQIGGTEGGDARGFELTREEARRLAALLLFESARLERPVARWRLNSTMAQRRSA